MKQEMIETEFKKLEKGETRENRSLAHNPQSSETGTEGTEFPTKEVKELHSSLVES